MKSTAPNTTLTSVFATVIPSVAIQRIPFSAEMFSASAQLTESRLRHPALPWGEKIATRAGYGAALVALADKHLRVVAMDVEVSNSTHSDQFAHVHPGRYFEMFIAEQLVAAAVGFSVRRYLPFASTFAAFFSRSFDFIRMAAVSGANICLVSSHSGVEIGADGPSQMGLEDLSMMRTIHGSTVFYPSDATSTVALVTECSTAQRNSLPTHHSRRISSPLRRQGGLPRGSGSKVLRSTDNALVTLIGAGVTVHHCLAAADLLLAGGIATRVIDVYSVKPIDHRTVLTAAHDIDGRLVIVEDHRPEGGLGSAVLDHTTLLYAGNSAGADDVAGLEAAADAVVQTAHGPMDVYLVAAPDADVAGTCCP